MKTVTPATATPENEAEPLGDGGLRHFTPLAFSEESTVVAEYVPEAEARPLHYESEAELEQRFIAQLERQSYEYLTLRTETELVANLRRQLERLNDIRFSEGEWERFFSEVLAKKNDGVEEKTRRIQEDEVQVLRREDGSERNVRLIDKQYVHNNRLQVINQYEAEGESEQGVVRQNRYDVTVLVNGLPLVHVELKRRGVDLNEAFNQIRRYQRDSFWAGCGLFDYMQLFVISNGTHTKYYSNTVRRASVEAQQQGGGVSVAARRKVRGAASFTFTSWWTDAKNQQIADLVDFTKTFFARGALLNVLTRYCVFNHDEPRKLLVMRPYQIVAAEAILQRIKRATHAKAWGTVEAGGYIWHSTGSGKTLTSFKAAQLACGFADEAVRRVLFVVDRKDLDHQTMREYNRFREGAAHATASTGALRRRLGDPRAKIIITTIQKLSRFVASTPVHPVYDEPVVIVFDECHRSQFGDMHRAITRAFRRYYLFGFTGTPIFKENADGANVPQRRVTEQLFGEELHRYTIVNAISDGNVLPFRIDYLKTMEAAPHIRDKRVWGINRAGALLAPRRIEQVVAYIRKNFDRKTHRNQSYTLQDKRVRGFNSLLAVDSVEAAKAYYAEFARQQAGLEGALKVALIYSFSANQEGEDGQLAEEGFEVAGLDKSARDFLEGAIQDYNALFGTSYDTTGEGFENYYRDLSRRLKEREVDLAIVVNMFLTGFDATTLNTLWVDKHLRMHGLIQAYSRTNRILNSVKVHGQIVCFRDLEEETNEALRLFGGGKGTKTVIAKTYEEYYAAYREKIAQLVTQFPLGARIVSEAAQREFVGLFGAILRLRNILNAFDQFAGHEILSERDFQDYLSLYQEIYRKLREQAGGGQEDISDDLVFEIELIKQVEVNVDYILMLVEQYVAAKAEGMPLAEELRDTVLRAVLASPSLRSKRDLIEQFLEAVSAGGRVDVQWQHFIAEKREVELEQIINEESLRAKETRAFMANAFRDGELRDSGESMAKLLPAMSRFTPAYGLKKQSVLARLAVFLERYLGLG